MMRVKSKNIHVLPTEKPSRLHKIENEWGLTHNANSNPFAKQQNIYITSGEEIKEGNWCLNEGDFDKHLIFKADSFFFDTGLEAKKIILTTDQDLIKDGVQAIDDEFLEWFVNNPSCEKVLINKLYEYPTKIHIGYKIIISKEEAKQETLEEAATNYLHRVADGKRFTGYADEDFINGAKWQQEQVGKSEFLQRLRATISDAEARRLIFEQFKNK
jgi:hypothetical protein